MCVWIARVALDIPVFRLFDYLAGDLGIQDIGCRLRVPFGSRTRVGILVALTDTSDWPADQLRQVVEKLDEQPLLSAEILSLLDFCAKYYHYPPGPTLFSALPGTLRRAVTPREPAHTWILSETGREATDGLPARARAQRALRELLRASPVLSPERLRTLSPSQRAIVRVWQQQGWLIRTAAAATDEVLHPAPELNAQQQAAVDTVVAAFGRFQPFLLHWVTGSGKTEVYLQWTQRILQQGGQVLVLVPEIRLTPQLTRRFHARFGRDPVALLHSELGETQRLRAWRAAATGEAGIVLGTRLALFTPMPRLQLIILDEEHDPAFNQQEGLRYAARDIAVVRAQRLGCPVVLGSATPSLESWHNARTGRYQRIDMTQRAIAGARLPAIRLIDTRAQKPVEGLTPALETALRDNLARGQQSLLFINRRGYAPALYCRECGWAAGCPRCSARLVLHRQSRLLRCHHCGYQREVNPTCPQCAQPLHPGGFGTQRLEHTLNARFPQARILRVDRDSAASPTAWEAMQTAIHAGEADILVGTQLLSKGHDFPALTLVGIAYADAALYSADFRATEHLFAQLMQVAGRAGRAQWPGEVWIQTDFPHHPLFQALGRHDFAGYADALLVERQAAEFPPFTCQAALRAEAPHMEDALQFLEAARACAPTHERIELFDPTAEILARKAGYERALLLAQAAHRPTLQRWLAEWMRRLEPLRVREVRWRLDVDPQQI